MTPHLNTGKDKGNGVWKEDGSLAYPSSVDEHPGPGGKGAGESLLAWLGTEQHPVVLRLCNG